ncbi:MAG TPA: TfuA-related McrA-glycine thioamidation protein [Methanolinea sp.]|nr:TfuA-related McrA-glycine thioamidation protein [Methanolinea sp.]HQK56041.1 TfuA-related McrA-glycine thioamidation protein [Methanolinea sp.]
MPRAIAVYLGPSCEREVARTILPEEFLLPPAARGDLTAASEDGARIITLIDGVFFQESAVGHREILAALKSGIRVIGASSMGALRAAELDTLGMEGVGLIYRLYRDGVLVSDDEVALVYDPADYAPLSEPLVNIRCTLRKAREEGILTSADAAALLSTARSIYFPDRTYPHICERAEGSVSPAALRSFLDFARFNAIDQKREDALEALQRTREIAREQLGL